jgi:hypothetical protein
MCPCYPLYGISSGSNNFGGHCLWSFIIFKQLSSSQWHYVNNPCPINNLKKEKLKFVQGYRKDLA